MVYITNRYNKREKAYICGGAIIGALSTIVATRYALFNESENLTQEVLKWGASLLINASTMVIEPYLPIFFYTGIGGGILGAMAAEKSIDRRYKRKKTIEEIISNIEIEEPKETKKKKNS